MPPVSVHFALGVAAAALVAPRFRDPHVRGAVAFGLVAGSVAPDLDLIASSLSFLVTGTVETGKLIHRTATHSYPLMFALLVAGFLVARSAKTESRRAVGWALGAAAVSDMVFHITPDLFYLVGVKAFFPFTMTEYHLGPLTLDRFTTAQNNVINGLDFASESLTWFFTAWLAARYGTTTRFTRWLPAFAVANFALYSALTVTLAFSMSYDGFLVPLYGPGVLNLLCSCALVPWLARSTWARLGRGTLPWRVPRPPSS